MPRDHHFIGSDAVHRGARHGLNSNTVTSIFLFLNSFYIIICTKIIPGGKCSEFQKISSPSLRDLFVEQLEHLILSGKLKIGEKLPPERQLAEMMQDVYKRQRYNCEQQSISSACKQCRVTEHLDIVAESDKFRHRIRQVQFQPEKTQIQGIQQGKQRSNPQKNHGRNPEHP